MTNTTAKRDTNIVSGKLNLNTANRIGHVRQKSAKFKSKKWYDRKEGKRID